MKWLVAKIQITGGINDGLNKPISIVVFGYVNKMGKKKNIVVDDSTRLKLFLFTAKEYIRFSDYFQNVVEKLDNEGTSNENRYIALQTLLLIMRKYESFSDVTYLKEVLISAEKECSDHIKDFQALQNRLLSVENGTYEVILSDGSKRSLREAIEDIQYGLYLHAEQRRIENLIQSDEEVFLYVVNDYLTIWDQLIRDTYAVLSPIVSGQYVRANSSKAAVVFKGSNPSQTQDIKNAPYWSNLRGKDVDSIELKNAFKTIPKEDRIILQKVGVFLDEVQKDNPNLLVLKKLTFPPLRNDWGDFSKIHSELSGIEFGISNKVRYNESKDIAYVLIIPNVPPKAGFLINQPQYSHEIKWVSLVNENKKWGWRIIHIGERVTQYKMSGSLIDWFKYTIDEVVKWNRKRQRNVRKRTN